jgi:hypothetical protein
MDPRDAFLEIPQRPRKCGSAQGDFAGVKAGWPCCVCLHCHSRSVRLFLSAETAALEDAAISILQHRSIRSINSLDTCECVLLRGRRWHVYNWGRKCRVHIVRLAQ